MCKAIERLLGQQEEEVLVIITRREAYLLSEAVLDGARLYHEACPEARRTLYRLGHMLHDVALPY